MTIHSESSGSLTRDQLERAAQLRSEGATWNAIRAEFGVKHGSSRWFALWRREGIDHIPPGGRVKAQREPVAPAADAAAEPTGQGEPQGKGAKAKSGRSSRARGAKKPASPKTSGAAMEPDLAARGIERAKPTTAKEA
jgi:hypothetical protein